MMPIAETRASRETILAAANMVVELNKVENLRRIKAVIEEAAAKNVDVLVLPEMTLQGYADLTIDPGSPEGLDQRHYFELESETLAGASVAQIIEAATKANMLVHFGMAEMAEAGDVIYNTAVLAGPSGIVGSYRKIHNRFELPYFTEGNDAPIFETRHGLMATAICYDVCFPELIRSYGVRGAEVILNPTAWSTKGKVRENDYYGRILDLTAHSNAFYNQLWIVVANQCGKNVNSRGANYHGGSQIVSPSGVPVASIETDEGLVIYKADIAEEIRRTRAKAFFSLNLLEDRRPEIYRYIFEDIRRS